MKRKPDGATLPTNYGYLREKVHAQSHEGNIGWPLQHRVIVERVRGKPLPQKAVIHHINGITTDNRPANLVVCQNQAYHKLLDARTRAYKACGNADFRRCFICDVWDDPQNMQRNGKDYCFIHNSC